MHAITDVQRLCVQQSLMIGKHGLGKRRLTVV